MLEFINVCQVDNIPYLDTKCCTQEDTSYAYRFYD